MSIEKVISLDRRLSVERNLDGSKTVYRKSRFNIGEKFEIIDIKNKFIGSSRWLRSILIMMDTQRKDIVARVARNNLAIRNRRADGRVHRDLVEIIDGGGDTFIN